MKFSHDLTLTQLGEHCRHGQQDIALLINPSPRFAGKVPLLGKLVNKALTWKV